MEFTTSKEVSVAPTFEAMHLKENLLRGIYAYGYESPSAVQSRAIVQICKGRDTIAQAQSGTGKTATFSISILQVIDTAVRETQGETSTEGFIAILCSPNAISSCIVAYPRIGYPNSICYARAGRLHERAMSCLHRRHKCRRRHPQARLRTACCVWNTWTSRRYDSAT